jgi:FAD/FMN-containing dehydrogenase/Fe-S oxidoreductase
MKPIASNAPEIRTDILTRRLYANDASMYEEMPQAVAFPRNAEDMQFLVQWALDKKMPITARAAGTSLAGQTTGGGLIVDTSRFMTGITDLDVDDHSIWVDPGVIRDSLNDFVAPFGLLYGPDTSTTNRCMVGGMIGNNSAGNFSVKYGSTRDHVIALDTVLSDGSRVEFGPLSNEELEQKMELQTLEGHIYREMVAIIREHRETILENSPHADIKRRNTGYALDRLCLMEPFVPGGEAFNLAKMLCGSEGTLALTVKAKVNLEPLPKFNILIISQFEDLYEALELTALCVRHKPAAVELVDDVVLNATKGNIALSRNRFFLQGEPRCILITQLDGDDWDALIAQGEALIYEIEATSKGYHHSLMTDADEKRRVWDLRKAGLGLLMGLLTENRSPEFVDDTAVRVEDLPNYIRDFEQIMQKYKTSSVYYAHASVGELHLRPSIDVKSQDGLDKMKAIAGEVAEIIRKYRGSFSGEHGDGRIRAPFLEQVLGRDMVALFERVKAIWDPSNLLNPNKIIYPKPMDTDLRFGPDYHMEKVDTVFKWRKEGGFDMALEACNGAGVCRKLVASGGTMCPSYRVTFEERDVTRGRANIFRQLFAGQAADAFASEELKDALSLCLSCKACKSECPANVDMARMKAEFWHGYHQRKGVPRSHQFFGNPGALYPMAMLTPGISNAVAGSLFGKAVLRRMLGVHPNRNLPKFASKSFRRRFKRELLPRSGQTRGQVLLMVDLFNDVHDPDVAMSAKRVLEHLGYDVLVSDHAEAGRTHISKGLLDQAKSIADRNIQYLKPFADQGIAIIGLEPSEILTLRDEYLDLCDDGDLETARLVAKHSFMLEEFLLLDENRSLLKERFDARGKAVMVHGHCHAKALVGMTPMLEVLTEAGYLPTDSGAGCCGMAGSFGYEIDTYEVSMQVGEQRLFPAVRALDQGMLICAHGFSCRHQITDGTGRQAEHPAVLLERAVIL